MPKTSSKCLNVLLDDDGMKDRSVVARASIGDIDGLEVLKQRVNVDENGMEHWHIINLHVMDLEFFFQKTRLMNIFLSSCTINISNFNVSFICLQAWAIRPCKGSDWIFFDTLNGSLYDSMLISKIFSKNVHGNVWGKTIHYAFCKNMFKLTRNFPTCSHAYFHPKIWKSA